MPDKAQNYQTMNEVIKTIYERRAVRKYNNLKVNQDLLDILLGAGRMAPSAMNKQPWKFYVITDEQLIHAFSKEISEIAIKEISHAKKDEVEKLNLSSYHISTMTNLLKNTDHIFYQAPVVILITTQADEEWGGIDVGMCAQNIMLAAKSLGLDTCPVGFAKYINQAKDFYELNIPDTEKIQLAILVGYGDEDPEAHERLDDNVVYI